ncbi:MAG: hypothetical protein KY462_04050 [Actinobacteria bacterium]|nr:hypothetical protein [Actinomycetota bacterium]MDP9021366.1 hypothetical protein [Actinomycetota bacterium]
MQQLITALRLRLTGLATQFREREDGFSTAELLGNAAIGILALLVIWGALQAAGVSIIEWITSQITSGGGGQVGR